MSDTPLVHIVLATYNGEKFLRQQLDSIVAQDYENWQVEICDDGSTDSTKNIVKEYVEKDSRFSLHENEHNLGYVMNFLEGIRRSHGDYIMLCDQDDIWYPNKISLTLNRAIEAESLLSSPEKQPVLVFGDAMNFESDSGKDMGRFHEMSHFDTKKVDTAHLFMENKCIGCTILVNKAVRSYLEEMPEEIRVHDWWLALICSHFGKICYVDEPLLRYRQHGGNMIGGNSYSSYVKKRISQLKQQRQTLRDTVAQGKRFFELFQEKMTKEQKEVAEHFALLYNRNWFMRKIDLIRYGFWKSGFTRNVGLLFLL